MRSGGISPPASRAPDSHKPVTDPYRSVLSGMAPRCEVEATLTIPYVANALVRGMAAGRRKGSSRILAGHACVWAIAQVARPVPGAASALVLARDRDSRTRRPLGLKAQGGTGIMRPRAPGPAETIGFVA